MSLASAQHQQHPAHMQQQFTYTDGFEFLRCGWDSASGQIGHIELNRPAASNAFNTQLWEEFPKVCGGVAPPRGGGSSWWWWWWSKSVRLEHTCTSREQTLHSYRMHVERTAARVLATLGSVGGQQDSKAV